MPPKFLQPPQAGQMQDTQVPAGRNDVHNALFKVRGGHHFKILGRDEFRRGPVQGPVHHHRAAEGGDAITPEGALQRVVETVGPGRAAGIVMLEYCSRGAPGEVLQDIRRIVHVGQIRLAGMLARLDHLALGQGGNNALPRAYASSSRPPRFLLPPAHTGPQADPGFPRSAVRALHRPRSIRACGISVPFPQG